MVAGNPDGVQGAGKDSTESKNDSQAAGGLHAGIRAWKRVVI